MDKDKSLVCVEIKALPGSVKFAWSHRPTMNFGTYPYPQTNETLRRWESNAKYLQDTASQLVPLGRQCRDAWANRGNADMYAMKVVKYLESIERISATMQECLLEFLEPSSYGRRQIEERLQFRNKHSACERQILDLQNKILEEEERYQRLVYDKEASLQKEQQLAMQVTELAAQKTDEALSDEDRKLVVDLKEKLMNWDKVQHQLRLQNDRLQIELQYLKQELKIVNQENETIKEQVGRISTLEEKVDEQYQKLVTDVEFLKARTPMKYE